MTKYVQNLLSRERRHFHGPSDRLHPRRTYPMGGRGGFGSTPFYSGGGSGGTPHYLHGRGYDSGGHR